MIASPESCCHCRGRRKIALPLGGLLALSLALLGAGIGACPSAAQTATPNQAALDLGSVNVGSASSATTVTFTFTAGGSIAVPAVLTMGAPNRDFTDAGSGTCTTNGTAHVYNAGDTCTVEVTFSPKAAGSRMGAIVLTSNATLVATAYLQGSGAGPQTTFIGKSSVKPLPVNFGIAPSVAVDGAGNVFYVSTYYAQLMEIPAAGGYSQLKELDIGYAFSNPLAVDGAGNLFALTFAFDAERNIHWYVTQFVAAIGYQSVATTPVTGLNNPSGIAVDGAGNVFFSDSNGLYEVPAADGYATVVTLLNTSAESLAVDAAGNVFWFEGFEVPYVQELTAASHYTQTIALDGEFTNNSSLAVDGSGNVFVYDVLYGIKEIPIAGGTSPTVVASGFGSSGSTAIAVDGNHNLFIAASNTIDELDFRDPPSLAFATTSGEQSNTRKGTPQTVTVQNVGNEPFEFSGLTYPTDFPEATGVNTDCTFSTTLDAGSTCTLSIEFSPLNTSATGPTTLLNESLTLTDNNLNVAGAVQPLPVSGTERASIAPPAITSPAPYSTFTGSSVTFSWTPGVGVTKYQLTLGSTRGASNIYNGPQTTAASAAVTGISVNGGVVFARLYYLAGSTWAYTDCLYAEFEAPSFTSPLPGSTLTGNSATFSWNPGGATYFRLLVGTAAGNTDLYNGSKITATSVTLTNLPEYGGQIFAKLDYFVDGAWRGPVATTCITPGTAVPPTLTSPSPGSALSGPSATFTWDPGHGSSLFRFSLGSTLGASDIYHSPQTHGNTAAATGIPTSPGTTVYARLYYWVSGRWHTIDHTYITQ